MTTIEPFTGPLTVEKISEWLSRCEESFDQYAEDNPPRTLTNKEKIHRAVASISTTQTASKPLATWYTQNRRTVEQKDWDTFRDMLKEHALGKGWRMKVLRNFYTYSQGSASLDDYFEKFEELKFTVARSSRLEEINDVAYKCHVLFGSRPEFVDKFLRTHKNDQHFIDYDVDDIRTRLKDFEEDTAGSAQPNSTQASNIPQQAAAGGLFLISGLLGAGNASGNSFSTLNQLPSSSSKAVGALTTLSVFHNNVSSRTQIQLFQATIGGTTYSSPSAYHNANAAVTMTFAAGEYLTQVDMTRDNTISAISFCSFSTSFNKRYSIGNNTGESMSFIAPPNFRIIGFHGEDLPAIYDSLVPGSYRYPISKLGVIFAPIPQ